MKVLNMNYLEHYKKNFDELLKLSDNEDFRKKNFDFFSQNGFPVKKKSDEREMDREEEQRQRRDLEKKKSFRARNDRSFRSLLRRDARAILDKK